MRAPPIRRLLTPALTDAEVATLRRIFEAAFGDDPDEAFTEADWSHAVGGVHFVAELDDEIVGHASVVDRQLHVADRPLRVGYVEAVAVAPPYQGRGIGTALMDAVGAHLRDHCELGALGTDAHWFYERLGWETWRGPSSVWTPRGPEPTPNEDGYIMVLTTPRTPPLDRSAPISCDWRPGDVW